MFTAKKARALNKSRRQLLKDVLGWVKYEAVRQEYYEIDSRYSEDLYKQAIEHIEWLTEELERRGFTVTTGSYRAYGAVSCTIKISWEEN